MDSIITDFPKSEYYDFIIDNFPWNWGSLNMFKWKHIDDPFRKDDDFYVLQDLNEIKALCVGRKYVYNINNMTFNILALMDFVTKEKYRQQGVISCLSDYVKNQHPSMHTLGVSSLRLYETVYHKLNCFQKYYTYRFKSVSGIKANTVTDKLYICNKFNNTSNSLHINKSPEYLDYLISSPKYQKIVFAEYDDLLVELNVNDDSAQLLDISEYSMESCFKAVQIASFFSDVVIIDLPEKTDVQNAEQIRINCCTSDSLSKYSFGKEVESIWIPLADRK